MAEKKRPAHEVILDFIEKSCTTINDTEKNKNGVEAIGILIANSYAITVLADVLVAMIIPEKEKEKVIKKLENLKNIIDLEQHEEYMEEVIKKLKKEE